MVTNMRISIRTEIFSKLSVSDPDTMYFHQAMKENDATQFLTAAHKKFLVLLSKVIFELITCRIVPEGETILPALWAMK